MFTNRTYLRFLCFFGSFWGSILLLNAQDSQSSGQYIADFLPEKLISCLYQDSQGYLWAGSQNGLHPYDGNSFRTFSHLPDDSTSLSQDFVWAICEGNDGALWIGTESGLNRYDKRTEQFELVGSLNGNIFQEKITAICEDGKERLWIGTEAGLFLLDKSSFELLPYDEGKLDLSASIKVIMEDRHGDLWIGTETRGVFHLAADGKALEQYTQEIDGMQSNSINQILETPSGELYVATDASFARYDQETKVFLEPELPGPIGESLGRSEVEAIAVDDAGNLWLGTFDNGLFYLQMERNLLMKISPSWSSTASATGDPITSLLIDHSGMLWIGTYLGGLHAFLSKDQKFNIFPQADPSPAEVYAVYEDANQQIWLGKADGLDVYDASGNLLNEMDDEVAAILPDQQGNIWLGTIGAGLKKWSPGTDWPPQEVAIDLPPNDFSLLGGINAMLEDKQNQLWIGTLEGIVVLDPAAQLKARFVANPDDSLSIPNDEVHVLFMDQSEKIWIGTDDGISYYDDGFFKLNIDSEAGNVLDKSAVYAIEEAPNGEFWVATAEGLVQIALDKKAARLIKSNNPDVSSQLYGLLFDARGDLWGSSAKGLWRVKTASFSEEVSLVTYLSANGELPCDVFNIGAHFRTEDDRLIFGCKGEAVWFRSQEVWQNEYRPPAIINSFQIGLNEVDFRDPEGPLKSHISQTKKIVLDPGLYRITLGYTALNYIFPEANLFRYRMDKVDENWIYDGGNQFAVYPLSSGNYVFYLQAANNEGIWNNEATKLEILILRPFTQTIWFYLICLLILGVAVFAFVRFRTRQLEATQRRLEEKVAQRTEEVNKKNEALEQTLEELKEAQTQLVEQEKMASLGQLTAGVAHEINNPITFVSGNITPLKRDINEMMEILKGYEEEVKAQGLEEKFNRINQLKDELDYDFLLEEIKQLLEGITEGAERTAEIVRGLRNFSRLDEDVLKLANINQGIESTLLLLRSELKDRIEIIKDMPEMPDIMCYPGKLNGVYMNILTNGMQAIEGPGKIYITTRHLGDRATISIRDTGPGMPEEVQKRIFEPFFTTKDVGFGTGLGLSITYGAIELHKGKITVNSVMGEGTEFLIELPVE